MHETPSARAWAASGAMTLTGRADRPPLVAPDGIVERTQALGASLGVDVLALLGERAALITGSRGGAISYRGSAQLLRAGDGWIACNLARDADVAAVPAWLGVPADRDSIRSVVRDRPSSTLVESAALLALPVAAVGEVRADDPVARHRVGDTTPLHDSPLVVDLSSLWAGPLCARLLAARGARVVKVESRTRPDGARSGPRPFFDLMQANARSVALDFGTDAGREALTALIQRADVVIEASRPRALRQLGIDTNAALVDGPRVWVSITGYGRDSNRVAFGDDAAAAGGLVAWDETGPLFVADAIADPVTGVAAATAAVACLEEGGHWLLDVAMTRVAAHVAGRDRDTRWRSNGGLCARVPQAPPPIGRAPELGADNSTVADELGVALP